MIVMWGSNARNAHPIFFHHVLKAIHSGAKLYSVDPRRSETAQFADRWLGLNVGTDIALSNTIAREIIHAGLVNMSFVERATSGFDEYAASVEPWTLERGAQVTGVPRRRDPRAGPRLRQRQGSPAVLDARHHRAPQRSRQRAVAVQPGDPHRPGRPIRRRAHAAARTEQRAGRRRHGSAPQQTPRIPGCHRRLERGPSSTPSGVPAFRPRTVGT